MTFSIMQLRRLLYLVFYTVYERWLAVALPLAVIPALVLTMSLVNEKKYINHATILIEESALLNPFLDELEFSFELSNRMDALRTLALSRKSLNTVIKDNNLVADFSNKLAVEEMQQQLVSAIDISLVGNELVRFQFKWNKPEQMKPVLESLVEQFIERLLAPTKSSLDTSEGLLKNQLQELRFQLENAEDALAKFKAENRSSLPELLNISQDTLARLEQDRQKKKVELSGAEAKLAALKVQIKRGDPALAGVNSEIAKLENQIALLRTRYTDKHSKIQSKVSDLRTLYQRRDDLKKESSMSDDLDNLWQMANSLSNSNEAADSSLLVSQLVSFEKAENTVAQLANEIRMLSEQVDMVTSRLSSSTVIDKKLRQLQRDYKVKQSLYRDMLQRYETSRVTGQLVRYEGSDKIKTIERAFSPTKPISHSLLASLIIGVALGIFGAASITFIFMILDMRVRDMDAIQTICLKPALLKIPTVNTRSRTELLNKGKTS